MLEMNHGCTTVIFPEMARARGAIDTDLETNRREVARHNYYNINTLRIGEILLSWW